MDAFPAFFPLTGRKVVVAGVGEAAEAKARLFEGSPAVVIRLEGPTAFLAGAYSGAILAFIAGDDLFVQAAAGAARAARALVNVVDRPELSDFFTPALIDRGEVVAAIGTGGGAPMLAALLRNAIETRIPEGSGRVAALLRQHQAEVREALPDPTMRRAFLREILSSPTAQAAIDGDMERASALLKEALTRGVQPRGVVRFVAGKGPSDLLTLRAARVLSEADCLVTPEDVEPAILGMARRDAGRLTLGDAGTEHLIALARAGRQVVRLVTGPIDPREVKALAEAGIAVEVLLAAPGG